MPELSPPAAITAARLQRLSPRCDYLAVAPALDRAAKAAGIATPRQVRHWLAQCAHECAGFTRWEEALSYSAERLRAVWPSRFPTLAAAEPYARNPRALANKVYGGRMGNREPDDGWRFRGRGPLMITGRDAYARAAAWTGRELTIEPDLAASFAVGARIAAEWWVRHGLNDLVASDPDERVLADAEASLKANEMDDVRDARRRINGGLNGLEDAQRWLLRAGIIWRD